MNACSFTITSFAKLKMQVRVSRIVFANRSDKLSLADIRAHVNPRGDTIKMEIDKIDLIARWIFNLD